jgi:hypothetical protein
MTISRERNTVRRFYPRRGHWAIRGVALQPGALEHGEGDAARLVEEANPGAAADLKRGFYDKAAGTHDLASLSLDVIDFYVEGDERQPSPAQREDPATCKGMLVVQVGRHDIESGALVNFQHSAQDIAEEGHRFLRIVAGQFPPDYRVLRHLTSMMEN